MTAESEPKEDGCDNGDLRQFEPQTSETPRAEVSAESAQTLTLEEQEGQRLADNGDLEGYYKADERNIARFEGLRYLDDKQQWIARFEPAPGVRSRLTHSDGTYSQVLRHARLLHKALVKPSQCFKALTSFDALFDREAAKLKPARAAGSLTPEP
jgi:hypothetical protein